MANKVTVSPRYMKYQTSAEVQALLEKVEYADAEPTAESANMISSGAVAEALGNYSTTEQMNDALAGKQDKMDEASEESVRGIVKNWAPDAQHEPEEEETPE